VLKSLSSGELGAIDGGKLISLDARIRLNAKFCCSRASLPESSAVPNREVHAGFDFNPRRGSAEEDDASDEEDKVSLEGGSIWMKRWVISLSRSL
jgi:hypothetical protein